MRYLALDLGEKRIGVAISDGLGLTAQPLPAIDVKDDKENLVCISKLIEDYGVDKIVVGLPRHMSGEIGKKGKEAIEFANLLEKEFKLPAITWDERLTTVSAERYLREMGIKGEKRRKIVDSLSAQLILQSYMDSRGQSGQSKGHGA